MLRVAPDGATGRPSTLRSTGQRSQAWGGLALDMKGNLWAPDLLNNQVVKVAQLAPSMNFGRTTLPPEPTGRCDPVVNFGPNTGTLNHHGFVRRSTLLTIGGTAWRAGRGVQGRLPIQPFANHELLASIAVLSEAWFQCH